MSLAGSIPLCIGLLIMILQKEQTNFYYVNSLFKLSVILYLLPLQLIKDMIPATHNFFTIDNNYTYILSYKWANLKNCTKLYCHFHKCIKIVTCLCTLKYIPIFFKLNNVTDLVITVLKRFGVPISYDAHIMCQWHNQPVPPDSLCRTDLVAVQCQFIFTLAEKYFYWPPTHVIRQDFIRW